MDMRFEAIVLHADDIDELKAFYERAGFAIDVDNQMGEGARVVQATPPGSAASVIFGLGFPAPDSPVFGMHLVVEDIVEARAALVDRGVEVGEIFHLGREGQQPGPDPQRQRYASMAVFHDPSGNNWLLQEVPTDS